MDTCPELQGPPGAMYPGRTWDRALGDLTGHLLLWDLEAVIVAQAFSVVGVMGPLEAPTSLCLSSDLMNSSARTLGVCLLIDPCFPTHQV